MIFDILFCVQYAGDGIFSNWLHRFLLYCIIELYDVSMSYDWTVAMTTLPGCPSN